MIYRNYPNHLFNPSCLYFSFPNTPSTLSFVNCNTCLRYGGRLYLSDNDIAGSKYLVIVPSDTVRIILLPQAKHLPTQGGLLYFSVHLLHLNCCVENFLKFPFISLSRCFSMTSLATSAASTALILSANSICPLSLSSMEGIFLFH